MSEVMNIPQLRFPEFSDAWEEKNVGDVLTIGSGRDYKHLNNGDIPVYGTGGYMTSVDSFLYDGESVCIGRKGTIDKPVLIDGKFWTVDTLFYTHSFVDLLPKFLFPLFKRINWKKYNEASGVPSLSKSTIEKIKLSLPTKPEQQKIAAFLTAVDTKIEQLSKKQELLGEYKKGVMQQIFSQAIRFKADDGCDFPDWEERKLGDFDGLVHGDGNWILSQDITKNGEYEIVQLGNIGFGLFVDKPLKTISEDKFTEINGTQIRKGDLLINRMVDSKLYCCLLKSDDDFITSVDVCWIRENEYFVNYFLMNLILFKKNQNKLLNLSSGSGRVRISKKNLFNRFSFELPSIEEQTKIANFLSSIDNKIEQVGKQLDESKQLKKALLQQMFV